MTLFEQHLVQQIIGAFFPRQLRDKLFFTHSKLSVKSKKQAKGWSPHQDSGYKKHSEKHSGLTIICALEDMDEENGCLRIYPGSHSEGPLEHTRVAGAKDAGDGQLEVKFFNLGPDIPIIAKTGDILVFDLNTIHYSKNPKSDSNRLAVITEVESMRWYQLDADRRPPIPVFENSSTVRNAVMLFITAVSPSFYGALLRSSPIGRALRKYLRRFKP